MNLDLNLNIQQICYDHATQRGYVATFVTVTTHYSALLHYIREGTVSDHGWTLQKRILLLVSMSHYHTLSAMSLLMWSKISCTLPSLLPSSMISWLPFGQPLEQTARREMMSLVKSPLNSEATPGTVANEDKNANGPQSHVVASSLTPPTPNGSHHNLFSR